MGKPTDIPVYYKSDFDFILQVFDKTGKEVFVGDMDFIASFRTFSLTRPFVAYRERGQLSNCFIEPDGRIHVVAKDHGLLPGQLKCELLVRIPDSIYPDGMRKDFTPGPVGICLTEDAGEPVMPLKARLTTIWVNAGTNGTLPFVFEEKHKNSDMETVYYDRGTGVFYRGGEVIPASEGTYNETAIDGATHASTTSEFRCGQTVYRHTGRELVNTAIERNPDQRLVRRAPSINAHPGLAYADRGIIRLPQPGPNAGDSIEISLAGLYWQENGSSETQPLSDLPIHTYTDKISCDLTVEKEGDKVVVTRTRDLGNTLTHVSHLWIELLSIDEQDGYIGVRYDSSGRKIFYRGHKHFPSAKYKVNRKLLASDIKRYVRFGNNGRGSKSCQLSYAGGGLRMQVQVWAKTRVRYRSIGYGYYDDNGLTHKYQWHWKDADGVIVRRKTCLVRVRKRAMKGAWSDWCYFHISPFINGGIAESRQKRT